MAKMVDFWEEYAVSVRNASVPDVQVPWFQRWVEQFSRHLRGVPLRDRSIKDVTGFLSDLKADERIAPWQVEQAREAIRILYRDTFGLNAKSMASERDQTFRDSVTQPRQLEAAHGDLLKQLQDAIRMKHYSPRTEEAYLGWAKRFIAFHDLRSPSDLDASDINTFLSYLATERQVASSTQNQALNAIVFLYSEVLKREPGDFSDFTHAKMSKRSPAPLSREQATTLIDTLEMPYKLMAILMYAAGLRVSECLSLKVHDIGFDDGTLHVHGKGAKDRLVMLPAESVALLHKQLKRGRELFDEDHLHNPALEWYDFFVFASQELRIDSRSRRITRGHMNRNAVQVALKDAARNARITAHVTPHCLRHSFAAHMLEDGEHIERIQELLGHARLSTTAIYAHPMNRPGAKPIDQLSRVRMRMSGEDDK
jgi:site-specific recombinase XerD